MFHMKHYINIYALVVQRIEQLRPKEKIRVQFMSGAKKCTDIESGAKQSVVIIILCKFLQII